MKKRDRIIALIIAIAFFGTSFALSFLVIWQIYTDNKNGGDTSQSADSGLPDADALAGTKLEGFTPVENVGELQKVDLQEGNGKEVKPGDTITVDYTGALAADGTIFESSLDSGQPATFPLDGVIQGWSEGIPGMKEGGKRRLIIPADMAYGNSPPQGSSIPPGAALVFDVSVLAVGE